MRKLPDEFDDERQTPLTDRTRRATPSAAHHQPPNEVDVARSRGASRRADSRIARAPPRGVPRDMQTEVVKLALDLLVREPDIEGFFGALTKTMVEESESHTCARVADRRSAAALRPVDGLREGPAVHAAEGRLRAARASTTDGKRVPVREHGAPPVRVHAGLDADRSSTAATIRGCPSRFATFSRANGLGHASSPRRCVLGDRTLGWMTVSQPAARRSPRASGGASC